MDPDEEDWDEPVLARGIVLTPYSYQRLDNLRGYDAGMPSPGFYEEAWRQRTGEFQPGRLLKKMVVTLRERHQILSTADLVAIQVSMRALAALRGRSHPWRLDLIDAVATSLVKDEIEFGANSPFLDAVHAVLRGERLGRLAPGTRTPPLLAEIRRTLATNHLVPKTAPRSVELDLLKDEDLVKSRILHRLRLLKIPGFPLEGGTNFFDRDDLEKLWECWGLKWSPLFEPACIEAARYGTSLEEAAASRLRERVEATENAAPAARLLIDAARAGIRTVTAPLLEHLGERIRSEAEFVNASTALQHLLYLYCYDEAFGTRGLEEIGRLVVEARDRSLWLLEGLKGEPTDIRGVLNGMAGLLECQRKASDIVGGDIEVLHQLLARIESDPERVPPLRGGAAGLRWSLGRTRGREVASGLRAFARPEELGDYLEGLFALGREAVQREPEFSRTLDALVLEYDPEEFQVALPALRLAFTYFTPREKISSALDPVSRPGHVGGATATGPRRASHRGRGARH